MTETVQRPYERGGCAAVLAASNRWWLVGLQGAWGLRTGLVIVLMAGVLTVSTTTPAQALGCGPEVGVPLDDGCLFTITGGDTPDSDDGFAVTNADGVPMWNFVREQDLLAIGYPISQRWTNGPFTLQAFQKVILQWDPGEQRVNWYNTLDSLATKYPYVELPNVPPHQSLEANQGVTDFGVIMRNHLALLDANSKIKAAFLTEPNWLNLYGLPIRYEEHEVNGNPQGLQVLRTQRTVFAIWNVPTPGTTIGSVVLQNVPDKIKRLRNVIIPDIAKQPTDPSHNPDIAAPDIVEHTTDPSQDRDIDRFFAATMGWLSRASQSGFANLSSQPWFPDQITDREKAWIVGLQYFSDYTSYERPIEEYHIANRTLHMNDGRQINVWIIREIPFGEHDDLLDRIEQFVRISEDFFGLHFPTTDIVFTITNEYHYYGLGTSGLHAGPYFMLPEIYLDSLEHELAHYYLHQANTSRWLVEGGADFLSAYVNHRTERQSIEESKSEAANHVQEYCMDTLGIPNLHHLNVISLWQGSASYGNCHYYFGNLFLLEILNTIGDTAMGFALNQIVGYNYGIGTRDEELYRLFLQFSPEASKDALRDLYRRMHGAPFTSSTPEPVAFAIHKAVAPVLTEILPWAANPPDAHHANALKTLVSLWWIDNDLMMDIARFDWISDGVNNKESAVINDLRRIAAMDVDLGKLASSFTWIVDDIKHWEDWAVRDLWLMVERNSDASSIVMHYQWMQDYLTFSEASALLEFRAGIQTEDWRPADEKGIAEILVTLPWISDGISRSDVDALHFLNAVASHGKDYFTQVMSVPWIVDGISSVEESASLDFLSMLAFIDLGFANTILGLAWTADGWDFVEWQVLALIAGIFDPHELDISNPGRDTHLDPALALHLMSFPWFADGINGHELSALGELRGMSVKDVALAGQVLGFGWFMDNITDVEARAVHHLYRITMHDIELARQVFGYPWVADGITESEVASLASMAP